MRNLATIQRVDSVEPIEGADAIEHLRVLGWHLVAKKDEFKVGDECVYVEIDSLLPERPEFEFMRPRGFKVKTIKLRGQVSQGIAFPMGILPMGKYCIGDDVTEVLGITKIEDPTPVPSVPKGYSRALWPAWMPKWFVIAMKRFSWFRNTFMIRRYNVWPSFIPKTEALRVQNAGRLLQEHKGKRAYVTEKLDGTSFTCYAKGDHFGVCSRNMELVNGVDCKYWNAARRYGLERLLKHFGQNIALQGELIGEGIQGNKYKIKGQELRLFSVYDIDRRTYLPFDLTVSILKKMSLPIVPVLSDTYTIDTDIDAMVEYSISNSVLAKGVKREGVVIRLVDDTNIILKAINPEFLLKYDA